MDTKDQEIIGKIMEKEENRDYVVIFIHRDMKLIDFINE